MLEKARKFYEHEYKSVQRWLESKYCFDKRQAIDNALQRCLGVCFFIQDFDISYEDASQLYDEYKEKIEKLIA